MGRGPDFPIVLHLIPSLVGGGAERQIGLLAPALLRRGVRVHVGYLHGGVNLQPLVEGGVSVHPVRNAANHDPAVLFRLCRLISRVRPDVVQTWLTQMDVMGGCAARLMRVPHILSERSSASMYEATWKNRLRTFSGRHASMIVANSEAGCAYWRSVGFTGPCEVIRNGLPLPEIVASPAADLRELGFAPGTRLVVFAGRISSEKNPLQLQEAISTVLASRPDVAAVFFGTGPLEEALRARAARADLAGRFVLAGYRADLWRWLRVASVVVCPSHVEGNPNVVLEAMAAGAPLLVSDIPAHREILDEGTAAFCDPCDAAQMAMALGSVLDRPEPAAARAQAARACAGQWSMEEAARCYLGAYWRVVRGDG